VRFAWAEQAGSRIGRQRIRSRLLRSENRFAAADRGAPKAQGRETMRSLTTRPDSRMRSARRLQCSRGQAHEGAPHGSGIDGCSGLEHQGVAAGCNGPILPQTYSATFSGSADQELQQLDNINSLNTVASFQGHGI